MRVVLPILLAVHGAIHVLGFLKWEGLATIPQLSGRTLFPLSGGGERTFAFAWLLAALVLVGAALLRVLRHDSWWMLALAGVLLSQCVIVVAWKDAKAGTIANALILVPAILAAAHARFSHRIDAEIRALYAQPAVPTSVVRRSELEGLPVSVQRWLETSGVVGRERVHSVRLKQRGDLRTSPNAAWMPARAQQYFSVDPPAFIWKVDATMMHVLPIVGRDKYVDGHGNMLIKAGSVVNVVNASDDKISHGSMLRFLGEIVWFPSAALSPYIDWEAIDATSAKATMRYGGLIASATFAFDDRGRVRGVRAERYLGGGASARLTPWLVSCSAWRTFDGVEVPSQGDVGWSLPTGYFSYYRWEILDVEFNRRERYRADATRRPPAPVAPMALPSPQAGAS